MVAQVRLPCHVAPTVADGDSYLYALLYRSLYGSLYASLYALLYGALWHRKTTAVQLYPLPATAPFLRPPAYCTWEATVRSPLMGERSQPLIPVLWLGYFRRPCIATS